MTNSTWDITAQADLEQRYRNFRNFGDDTPVDQWHSPDYNHRVLHTSMIEWARRAGNGSVRHWIIDPPGIPLDWTQGQLDSWWAEQLGWIDLVSAESASMIIIPRERKGSDYSKASSICSVTTRGRQWRLWREYTWLRFDGDFHRSHSLSTRVFAFVRGAMTSNSDSPIRYKDVLVHRTPLSKNPEHSGAQIDPVPVLLYEELISLFSKHGDTIVDPYAGTGNTAQAALNTGRQSLSIELHPEVYARLVEREKSWYQPSSD